MDVIDIGIDIGIDIDIAEDDDIEILDIIDHGIPRQLYIRENHFDMMNEVTFRKRFRLTKQCVLMVLQQIEDRLEYPSDMNNCVSPINQLLTGLRFFSTGGHLDAIADFMGMHVSTASRIILRVSQAIAEMYDNYITFPINEENIRKTQQDFFDIASFPRVLGAIDCTHIRIQSPGGDDSEIYRNRKSYFSINAQMVCNSSLRIMNIVARWPGSVHDSTIFNNSRLRGRLENGEFRNCLLLGDSGYPNKSYLFTPLLHPNRPAEQRYNESHIRTRNTIERCFGVLKKRFPILAYGCRLKVETTLIIIVATSILHNIAIDMGEHEAPPIPDELEEHILNNLIEDGQIPGIHPQNNEPVGVGYALRTMFINNYFANL